MPYMGNPLATAFSTINKQDLTGGAGTNFTLSYSAGSSQDIEVFVNNVRQEPGVAYTANGTSLTMTGSIVATDDFYVVFQGKAQQTVVPGAGTITQSMFSAGLVLGGGSFKGDSGGGVADIIRVHEKELNTSLTIDANTNGMCAGPLTLASGVVITVSAGATLVVT